MITRPADLPRQMARRSSGRSLRLPLSISVISSSRRPPLRVTSAWPSRRDRKLGMDNTRATELLIGDGGENHHPVVDRERRLGGCGHRLGVVAALGYS
jgi:hypothetical protein